MHQEVIIDEQLVHRLVSSQFPQWKDLPIQAVAHSGWDNRSFHLGEEMLIRMPSGAEYAPQVEKEHRWLPKLAPLLPLKIPDPLAIGEPGEGYSWKWSIYRWLEGESANLSKVTNLPDFAHSLAQFLLSLHSIDSTGGPESGPHNFYRGGPLKTYNSEVKQALNLLRDKIDVHTAAVLWEKALSSSWQSQPVWIHGDISAGNLLVQKGELSAVIDFGQLGIGDPACDLMIAWTLFEDESRDIFRTNLLLDHETWARGRGWTLWKSLMYLVNDLTHINFEASRAWHTIDEVIKEHQL